jgi:hypothetical protein
VLIFIEAILKAGITRREAGMNEGLLRGRLITPQNPKSGVGGKGVRIGTAKDSVIHDPHKQATQKTIKRETKWTDTPTKTNRLEKATCSTPKQTQTHIAQRKIQTARPTK